MTANTFISFFYGLAFFSMGLAIFGELGHESDTRLRRALAFMAAFGFIHSAHEWLEMFDGLGFAYGSPSMRTLIQVVLLGASFLCLGLFGARLRPSQRKRHAEIALGALALVWAVGLIVCCHRLAAHPEDWRIGDAWTRYVLAIPASLLAAAGLIAQKRVFERSGLPQFARDCAVAAATLVVYGLVGQTFTHRSALPPSTVVNQELFENLFGFSIHLLRAVLAAILAYFVMRFLRSFEFETRRQISRLQQARLDEATARETLRLELLRRSVEAQERERQRIARDLHDETGQALTAIGMGLRGTSTALTHDAQRAIGMLRGLEALAARSLDELQRVINDLRPSHLDHLGLAAALRWYVGDLQRRAPLQITVETAGEARTICNRTATALFRVAQEALTNAVKHAQAAHARVLLSFADDRVSVCVSDDGHGFEPSRQNLARGAWGLIGMEERAHLLGGAYSLDSAPGRGTRVEVWLPYGQDEKEPS